MLKKINLIKTWSDAWFIFQKEFNFNISEEKQEKIKQFYKILYETNLTMNLTRLSSEEDFLTFHLLDTVLILNILQDINLNNTINYLDLGSGNGVPSIFLHILLPEIYNINLNSLLCDTKLKKINYLNKVIQELNLNFNSNTIQAIHQRAEILATEKNTNKNFFCDFSVKVNEV